jgi:UDP-glucose 4-epimerase
MKRILITGGAGFIGSHLASHLSRAGNNVTILDDFSSGTIANVASGVRVVEGSIADQNVVQNAMRDCDAIFHLAALVSVPGCIENWQYGHQVNIGGTINVFEAAVAEGGLPVIYASSAAVYGDQEYGICSETTLPVPLSPYGADKLSCEHHARAFYETAQLPSVGLRFFNIYGPGQSIASPYAGVIARFCNNASAGTSHTVFGDGQQVRDFVFIDDLVEILHRFLNQVVASRGAVVSNVCTGEATNLLDLVAGIDKIVPGSGRDVTFKKGRSGDIVYSQGDTTQMQNLIGEMTWTSLVTGLRRTLNCD